MYAQLRASETNIVFPGISNQIHIFVNVEKTSEYKAGK